MKCEYCGEDYDGRSGSKTCRTRCRVALKRYNDKLSVTGGTERTRMSSPRNRTPLAPSPVLVQPDTAPSTQNTDEQEAGESTKSETPEQLRAMKEVAQIEPNILDHIDMNKVIDVVSDAEQHCHCLPGDSGYTGCVTPERIAASRRSRSQPPQAQPVDESKVKVEC